MQITRKRVIVLILGFILFLTVKNIYDILHPFPEIDQAIEESKARNEKLKEMLKKDEKNP